MSQLLLGLVQVALAVILSAVTVFLTVYLFQWFTRDLDEWQALRQGNPAVGVVLGAVLIAVAMILRPALSLDTTAWDVGSGLFVTGLLAECLQLAVGLVFAVITVAAAVAIFAWLTRGIDEIAELKSGNLAVAGLLAGVVIGIGLMVSQPLAHLMTSISSLVF